MSGLKGNAVYPYNGELFANKKGMNWHRITHGQILKQYATQKKPVIKDHILYDSVYIKCPEYTNL